MAHSKKAKIVYSSFQELSRALEQQAPERREDKDLLLRIVFHFTQAVFPERPPIDKVGAFVLVERRQRAPIVNIAFWGNPVCSVRQLDGWRANGILPIDLGEEKYNRPKNNVGSATEFIAKNFFLDLSPAEQRFVFLLNEHNRTGKLKQYYMSAAWLMRELYELEEDHAEIIFRMAHVIEMHLEEEEKERIAERTDEKMREVFPSYLEEVKKCGFAPFTPGRYLRDMWRLGIESDDIREKVEWWIQRWHRVQAALERAEETLRSMDWRGKEYCVGNAFKLRFLETDDKFLVKKASRSCDVLLTQGSSGYVAILAYGCDVRALGAELAKREPDRWHTAETQGFVLNGGRMYTEGDLTELSRHELLQIIREYPPVRRLVYRY